MGGSFEFEFGRLPSNDIDFDRLAVLLVGCSVPSLNRPVKLMESKRDTLVSCS